MDQNKVSKIRRKNIKKGDIRSLWAIWFVRFGINSNNLLCAACNSFEWYIYIRSINTVIHLHIPQKPLENILWRWRWLSRSWMNMNIEHPSYFGEKICRYGLDVRIKCIASILSLSVAIKIWRMCWLSNARTWTWNLLTTSTIGKCQNCVQSIHTCTGHHTEPRMHYDTNSHWTPCLLFWIEQYSMQQ